MSDRARRQPLLVRQCQKRKRGTFITVTSLAFVIAVLLLAFFAFGEEDHNSTLLQVSIIFRHGDRTPTETYPLDPHKDDKTWPDGWGALTKKGKLQMYELGKYLRKRYDGFLSKLYLRADTRIDSSDNDRCLMSAQLVLAGLYPPYGSQVWKSDLSWQPIPVHATPRNLDKLIVMKKPCPAYDQELNQAYLSPEIQKLNQQNKDLFSYLTTNTGEDMKTITDVEFLFNTLEIEDQNNLPLPEWTKSVYPDRMKILAAESLAIFTKSNEMKRLQGGPLVGQISQHMADKRNGALKSGGKLFLYSAHDITIVNVWRTLGFTERIKPEYGASLIVELHTMIRKSSLEVKLFYLNSTTTSEPYPLIMDGCEPPCLLDTFLNITKNMIPTDWDKECELNFK